MTIIFELKSLLVEIQDKLLNYLFNEKDIEKWENNKKVKINDNFKPLLQGDWSRYQKVNCSINLDKYLEYRLFY